MNQSLKDGLEFISKKMNRNVEAVKAEAEAATEEKAELRAKGATDPISTSNTGYGAELIHDVLYKDELYSQVIEDKQNIFGMLPGSHGEVNAPSVKVSIKGKVDKFNKGSEFTSVSSHFYENLDPNNALASGRVTIPINEYQTKVMVTKQELQYSTDRQLFTTIQDKIVKAASRTQTALLLNADTETNTATGNVNHKDSGTPVSLDTTSYYLNQNNGLRKLGIANGIIGGSVAYDSSVYKEMLDLLGDYSAETDNLMWILSSKTGVASRYVPGYRTMCDYGNEATVKTAGTPSKIEGIEMFQTTELGRLVGTDGYIYQGSTATAANTQGQLLCLYKPSVQFAFGMPMQMVVHEVANAFIFDVAMYFGFQLANETAGLDKTVSMGVVNV